ncbi:DUF4012 domain-containing protein [Arthrobacter sp. NPDC057388]|uniref:DUF4012 domain-containing protein n=1 Tax=Arthrobacter sp. NPDC057388 TaxID=3346116 RepID=UPI0036400DBE
MGTVAGLLLVVALAAAWLGLKASTISSELSAANDLVPVLRENVVNGDSSAAKNNVTNLMRHTANARAAAADPLWTIAGATPVAGVNFRAATEIAMSADDIATLAAAPLVDVYDTVDWKSLKPTGQGIQLKPLAEAQPKLSSAANAVRQSSDRLNVINAEALVPQIAAPLLQARTELTSLRDGLDIAADAAQILPSILGHDSPRSYLLLIQNNAELRATGGIPGALAVLNVNAGKLSLSSQTSATELGLMEPRVRVDPEQQQIYSTRLGKFVQDVNLTPDFPTAAQTAKTMWERKTHQVVDGVLAIDPVALSYVLEATGPIDLTDPTLKTITQGGLPTRLTAKNIVPTLLSDVYEQIPEPDLQDVYFAGVAKKVFTSLSAGMGDFQKLIDVLGRGAHERRVQLWLAANAEQAVVSKYSLSGSVTGTGIDPAQFGVYFNDGTGAKMDFYVKRTVQLIEECPVQGYGQVKVRITSTNTAPKDAATSLPPYVTGGGAFGVPEGSVQTNIIAYGPIQANIETAVVEGRKAGFASFRHAGRPVGALTIRLAPGQSSTVEFAFGKIVQHTAPQLSVTPTVQPQTDVLLTPHTPECLPLE